MATAAEVTATTPAPPGGAASRPTRRRRCRAPAPPAVRGGRARCRTGAQGPVERDQSDVVRQQVVEEAREERCRPGARARGGTRPTGAPRRRCRRARALPPRRRPAPAAKPAPPRPAGRRGQRAISHSSTRRASNTCAARSRDAAPPARAVVVAQARPRRPAPAVQRLPHHRARNLETGGQLHFKRRVPGRAAVRRWPRGWRRRRGRWRCWCRARLIGHRAAGATATPRPA